MKKILFIIMLMLVFSMPVCAEENLYDTEYELSGVSELNDTLDENTKDFFEDNELDVSDYNWVNNITSENVFSHIISFFKEGCKTPFRVGLSVIGVILIISAIYSVSTESEAMKAAIYASVLAISAVLAVPVYNTVTAATNAIKGCGTFMLSFIPVFAGIVTASGSPISAISMSGLLLAAAEGVTFISAFVVLPLMGGYLAITISSSVSPLISTSGIADGIKKIAVWIMSFATTIFLGILSIQTAVNAAADSLTMRTTKFILGSSVPVAGGVLSEAVSTVVASMGLLKSSVGIYGVVVIAVIFIPIIIELVLWRVVLLVTSIVSEIFSQGKITGILKAVDMMLSLLLGIILLTAAMFIISLSVVVTFGRTQ